LFGEGNAGALFGEGATGAEGALFGEGPEGLAGALFGEGAAGAAGTGGDRNLNQEATMNLRCSAVKLVRHASGAKFM
jgi:hypothetical protein